MAARKRWQKQKLLADPAIILGCKVMVMGITNNVNKTQLIEIGSQPTNEFVSFVLDFAKMDSFVDSVKKAICLSSCK